MAPSSRNYLIVTASYWGFTLTDGALRMLVLLYFFKLGYSPFTLAFLFLLYELAGILANLVGGWLATRYGIPRMLMLGQLLQIGGLVMLSALDPTWPAAIAVAWVVGAQGVAGLAKDFTKTASKSAIKATSVEGSGQLFRWVAWFTGSKNAMKGLGFFAGGLLLQNLRLPRRAVADGGVDRGDPADGIAVASSRTWQSQSLKKREGAIRKIAPGQSPRCGARVSIRRPRRVVCGRSTRLPLCQWMDLP
jgi:MFS family permease